MKSLTRIIFAGWMRFAKALELVLLVYLFGSFVYLLVLGPVALIVRAIGRSPMGSTKPLPPSANTQDVSYWTTRSKAPSAPDRLDRQF